MRNKLFGARSWISPFKPGGDLTWPESQNGPKLPVSVEDLDPFFNKVALIWIRIERYKRLDY